MTNQTIRFIYALLVSTFCFAITEAAEPVRYNRDVRPILSDKCFACHGPDKANLNAGLRLDVRESAIMPAESGAVAITPLKFEESELITRILSNDDDEVMPPPRSHKKLTEAEKEILKRWIAEGAIYEKHWSFVPLTAVKVPDAATLRSTEAAFRQWPRNEIDWFVLHRLTEAGLKPSPPADANTLARRIALDLTGLPLAADAPREPTALMAMLFQSPHYGERMALDWLDAARFADTQGYQVDRDQDMHPWRDWVIQAFNSNMRFDQFTIEQLAGDLLPNATLEQKVATGFHRNHMVNVEGGIIPAEFIAEYTADRVETTAAVWMGQTFNCTRCHDHKFDPFTQKDFYSMKAFFNNVGESGLGNQDSITIPVPEVEARIAPLAAQVRTLEDRLAKQAAPEATIQSWAERLMNQPLEWTPFEINSVIASQGKTKLSSDRREIAFGRLTTEKKPHLIKVKAPTGQKLTAVRLECASESDGARVTVSGIQLTDAQGKAMKLTGGVSDYSRPAAQAEKTLGVGVGANVILTPGPNQPPEALVWEIVEPSRSENADEELTFSVVLSSAGRETDWRILFTESPRDQLVAQSVLDIAALPSDMRSKQQSRVLQREYVLSLASSKVTRQRINDIQDRIATLRELQPNAIVMEEQEKTRDTFVLMRGVYDKPGEKVTAATPDVLPPLGRDMPPNRLGLARWLVSPEHPLTARVTVNRLWQSFFGTGLVSSSEDFGSQGELPSHPELLDWLAREFIRSGWDVQHIQRLIISSATYQQSSCFSEESLRIDPANRLLSRGPRFRLHAEFVRDQALAAAGLLSHRIGGKSVKPYHPPGLYELVTAGRGTTKYIEDKGEGLHRRSLYTYWKRSVPHPAMIAFDAPGREVCTLRRARSNTPLQALNLMNDPTYIEAARHLAHRMITAAPQLDARIRFGYETLLARAPSEAELNVLTRAFERTRATFSSAPDATTGLLQTGQPVTGQADADAATLAAMTSIASTMLCLDETITKE